MFSKTDLTIPKES